MKYNWQLESWPEFQYNIDLFDNLEKEFFKLMGQNIGLIEHLNLNNKRESILNVLIQEAIKTSAIEGEMISRMDVVSSIKKNLGYSTEVEFIKDKRAIGIAEALVSSRESFNEKLSDKLLFQWHKSLFQNNNYVHSGKYRVGIEPMQVISGLFDKVVIHFEAPPSSTVPLEMKKYIQWFNNSSKEIKNPIIRSSIAHLYFESIHPFEDGNGRIGRILSEKILSQSINQHILLSLSNSIEKNKNRYYQELKYNQRKIEINDWILFFGEMIIEAQNNLKKSIEFTIKKTKFIDKIKLIVNEKQLKAILKMLDEELFIGGMNATKYISINRVSKATATRDLTDLVKKNILNIQGGGRSTSYQLNFEII